jgi:NAD(P)H-hydrate epimerase
MLQRMRATSLPPRLAPRPKDANKASVGRVLVAGGSLGMAGAPALAGLGALRAGAGLVRVAVPWGIASTVASFVPEITVLPLPESADGSMVEMAAEVLLAAEGDFDAVVVGPGAGRSERTVEALRTFCTKSERPLVIDADALFAWNGRLPELAAAKGSRVLTPHEGEAARLLGTSSQEVRAARGETAARIASAAAGVALLKGPGTLVTDGRRLYRNATGGPLLATAGSGDVLAGVVGALLGAGHDAFDAAAIAAHVHGRAGDLLSRDADRGVLASEVAAALPRAIRAASAKSRGKRR